MIHRSDSRNTVFTDSIKHKCEAGLRRSEAVGGSLLAGRCRSNLSDGKTALCRSLGEGVMKRAVICRGSFVVCLLLRRKISFALWDPVLHV